MKYARVPQRQKSKLLVLYVTFLLIWSVSVLLMPIASALKSETRALMFVSGGTFWIGAIGTVSTAVAIELARRKSPAFKEKKGESKRIGLICFFKNTKAKIADISMLVSIGGFVLAEIFCDNIYLLFTLFSAAMFSFGMHCMLNGSGYKYLKSNG